MTWREGLGQLFTGQLGSLENFILDNFVSDPIWFAEKLDWLFTSRSGSVAIAPISVLSLYPLLIGFILGINAWYYQRYLPSLTPEERKAEKRIGLFK